MNNHVTEPYLFDEATLDLLIPPAVVSVSPDNTEITPLQEITAKPGTNEYAQKILKRAGEKIGQWSEEFADDLRELQNHARPYLSELQVLEDDKITNIKGINVIESKFPFDETHSYRFILDKHGKLYRCPLIKVLGEDGSQQFVPDWAQRGTDPRLLIRFYQELVPALNQLIAGGNARSANVRDSEQE